MLYCVFFNNAFYFKVAAKTHHFNKTKISVGLLKATTLLYSV